MCLSVARGLVEIFVPGALVGVMLAASLVLLRYRPTIGLPAVSFFLILAPTSSIMPISDPAFEHRMYLPLSDVVTLLVVIGFGAWNLLWQRLPTAAKASRLAACAVPLLALAAIITALGWRTMLRNEDYRSELAIWADTVRQRPENPRAHAYLAHAYQGLDNHRLALDHFNIAIELNSSDAEFFHHRGAVYRQLGRHQLAIADYVEALELRPNYVDAYFNRANALRELGHYDLAFADYSKAVELDPNHEQLRRNLAEALGRRSGG